MIPEQLIVMNDSHPGWFLKDSHVVVGLQRLQGNSQSA